MTTTMMRWIWGGVALAVVAVAASAQAADFAQRRQWADQSARAGLGRSSVPLLRRVPGNGRAAVMDAMLRRFAESRDSITTYGEVEPEEVRDRLAVAANGWFLEVAGDGTNVSYRNYGFLDKRLELARPVSERMKDAQLEELGRRFIAENLEGFIRLGDGEEIVPLFTEFQVGGGGSTEPGARPDPEYVVAGTVVFTRTVDGVPVVGGGSKIAVVFDNEGQPVGFDFDWPVYERTGRAQRTASRAEVQERMDRLAVLDSKAPGFEVQRFECGYFDPGTRRRDREAVVQAACSVQASQRTIVDAREHARDPASGHVLTAISTYIPAGAEVEPDRSWPEAQTLSRKPVREREPCPGAGPGSEDLAPGEKAPESDAEKH